MPMKIEMKIAKASQDDINACFELAALLNTVDDGYYPSSEEGAELIFDPDDKAHLRLFYDKVKACMDKAPGGINRIVWGFGVLADNNVFDPDVDHLELHPRLTNETEKETAMKTLWIVASTTEEYGRVYLTDYAGQFKHDVENKVMEGAWRERFEGSLTDRLEALGWEIVCLHIEEEPPIAEKPDSDGGDDAHRRTS